MILYVHSLRTNFAKQKHFIVSVASAGQASSSPWPESPGMAVDAMDASGFDAFAQSPQVKLFSLLSCFVRFSLLAVYVCVKAPPLTT